MRSPPSFSLRRETKTTRARRARKRNPDRGVSRAWYIGTASQFELHPRAADSQDEPYLLHKCGFYLRKAAGDGL